jgi:hypothetical protein
MNVSQRTAFIEAQVVCAQAELEAMKIANYAMIRESMPPIYGPNEYRAVPYRFGLDHNSALQYLREG